MRRGLAALDQQANSPAPVLDELDGLGVGQVPRALTVDLNQLIAHA